MYDEQQVPMERNATCENCGGESVPLSGDTVQCFDCGRTWGDSHTSKHALLNAVNHYGDENNSIDSIDGERGVITVTDASGWTREVKVTTLYAGESGLPEWSELWSGLYDGVGEVAVYYRDRDVIERYLTEPPLDVFLDSLDTGPDPKLESFLDSLDTGIDAEQQAFLDSLDASGPTLADVTASAR